VRIHTQSDAPVIDPPGLWHGFGARAVRSWLPDRVERPHRPSGPLPVWARSQRPVALAVRGDDMWVVNDLPEDRGMVAELTRRLAG